MFKDIPTLTRLLHQLQKVPYLATKNMHHVAEYFLRLKTDQVEQFIAVLREVNQNIALCNRCFAWKENKIGCIFCSAEKRDQALVCVVETWQELLSIEKTKGYSGVYHVLGGVISPLEGVGPEDLTIKELVNRFESGGIVEIVFATNQTPEGEATAAFIATKLKNKTVKISCLARGLPVGSSLDAMDRVTVHKALSERRPF